MTTWEYLCDTKHIGFAIEFAPKILPRRHNKRDGVSNHQPYDCLLNRLFTGRSKKTSKLRVTGLCEGNSPVIGEFPAQKASNAEMFPFDDVIMKDIVLMPRMQYYCSMCKVERWKYTKCPKDAYEPKNSYVTFCTRLRQGFLNHSLPQQNTAQHESCVLWRNCDVLRGRWKGNSYLGYKDDTFHCDLCKMQIKLSNVFSSMKKFEFHLKSTEVYFRGRSNWHELGIGLEHAITCIKINSWLGLQSLKISCTNRYMRHYASYQVCVLT